MKLSILYPYYRNPKMLAAQYERWASFWPLFPQIEFIVVDDGSPEPALDVRRPSRRLPLRIYRVTKDLPWHQDGARNLAATMADGQWLFFGDMDHMLTEAGLRELLALDQPRFCYRFPRRLISDLYPLKPAVNVFACTYGDFWATGGYDERFCGAYGSDIHMRARMHQILIPGMVGEPLEVYLERDIEDACTRGMPRSGPENEAKLKAAERAAKQGPPKVLDFDWVRVL